MTTHYKTQAFVFKKEDINETDRFFSVFSKDFGRLDIFAKAIRKSASKLRSGIDIFFVSEIEFVQGKNKKILIDATAIEKLKKLVQNPKKFQIALAISDVLENFLKGQEKDEKIFELLKEIFTNLENRKLKDEKYNLIYYYFLWNFLSLLGYQPQVQRCTNCSNKLIPYDIYFSNREGGIICKKCFDQDKLALKINSDVVKILRIILVKDLKMLIKLKIKPFSRKLFKEISEGYYSYILHTNQEGKIKII